MSLRVWRQFGSDARNFLWISFWVGISLGIGTILLNLYLVALGYSTSFLGLLMVNTAAGAGVAALPIGRLADRFGKKMLLFAGGALAGVGQMILLFHPTPHLLLLSAWISGIGGATLIIVAAPLLHDYAPQGMRTKLYSWHFATGTLAAVLGNFIGGWLPSILAYGVGIEADSAEAYRWSLFIGLLVAGMAALPLYRLREPCIPIRKERTDGRDPGRQIWNIPWMLAVPQFLTGMGAGLFLPYLNLFFTQHLGAETSQAGLILGVEAVTAGLAGLGAPLIGRSLGRIRGVVSMRIVAIPFLLLMVLLPSLWAAAAASWIRNGLANATNPLITEFSMAVSQDRQRSTVNSIINVSYQAGWALSAAAGGWFIQHMGYAFPYYLTAGLYLTANGLYYIFFRKWDEASS